MAIGVLAGAFVGPHTLSRIGSRSVRTIFVVVLVATSNFMIAVTAAPVPAEDSKIAAAAERRKARLRSLLDTFLIVSRVTVIR